VVYESERKPELYTAFYPILTGDGDEVVIEYEALN
jgi:hypothetical protein